MLKRLVIGLIVGVFVLGAVRWGSSQPQEVNTETAASGMAEAKEVGNKICPVSGEDIESMGGGVQYEYKGKIYNFCCSGCIEEFKKDPERYVAVVERQMGQNQKDVLEKNNSGHYHLMGAADMDVTKASPRMGKTSMKGKESMPMFQGEEANVKEVTIEAYQFGYSPDRIIVKKGDAVKLLATSRDVTHGISIKEYGIDVPVKKGSVQEIDFVADKAGEFDIRCSVYCGLGHQQMEAKLIVEE